MSARSSATRLILEFEGWCLIRQPTDPDPYDEPRGASGYTFAFGDEPDLDRIVRLQPSPEAPVRSRGHPIGVVVTNALQQAGTTHSTIDALIGAKVDLLGEPKLENRNWTLTPAGFEPIVPFELEVRSDALTLRRAAPLDVDNPSTPVWLQPEAVLKAQAANGVEYEPATIGKATGIWDSLAVSVQRKGLLEADLEAALRKTPQNEAEIAILVGRMAELSIGIENPSDRRVTSMSYVERFGFDMFGAVEVEGDEEAVLGGTLVRGADQTGAWGIRFWIGGWDTDLMSAYFVGALDAPYAAG